MSAKSSPSRPQASRGRRRQPPPTSKMPPDFGAFMDHSPAVAWVKDATGRYIYVNLPFARFFGGMPEDWPGRCDTEVFPPDVAQQLRVNDLAVLESGKSVELIETVPEPDGRNRTWQVFKFPVDCPDGRRCVGGMALDITDRLRAEEAVRRHEGRLATVLRQIPHVVLYETGGEREFISENVVHLLGYTAEELTTDRMAFANLIHPDDALDVYERIHEWHYDGEPDILTLTFRARRRDGEWIWLEDRVARVRPPEEKAYMTGVLVDITQRRAIEEQLQRSADLNRLMLRELNHRVRNNLAALLTLIDLSARGKTNVGEFSASLKARIEAMAAVHALLSESHYGTVELRSLISSIIPGDLTRQTLYDGPDVHVFPRQATAMSMVIVELLTNSIKHGALSAREGQVRLHWRVRPGGVPTPSCLRLDWTERGGPPLEKPPQSGVGIGLIQGLVRSELGGEVTLGWPPAGAKHRLILSLDDSDEAFTR